MILGILQIHLIKDHQPVSILLLLNVDDHVKMEPKSYKSKRSKTEVGLKEGTEYDVLVDPS